jgi:predicted secreted protein
MRRALAALAVVLMTACAAPATTAQSPTPPPSTQPPAGTQGNVVPVVELTSAMDGAKVTVRRDGEVKLLLELQGMFEFAWELESKVEPALAPIGERIYVGKGTNAYDVLAGGWTIYRFRAEQPGKATLQLAKHSRADGKTVATVHYDVIVE